MPENRVFTDVLVYLAARLALAVALAAAIYGLARLIGIADFPVYVAAAFAIVIAFPLGMWVFTPLRLRATAGMAIIGERRRRDREALRARLRGEASRDEPPDEPGKP